MKLKVALSDRHENHLHSMVVAIRDNDAALLIDRQSIRTVELAIS